MILNWITLRCNSGSPANSRATSEASVIVAGDILPWPNRKS